MRDLTKNSSAAARIYLFNRCAHFILRGNNDDRQLLPVSGKVSRRVSFNEFQQNRPPAHLMS
jgi:hypothetical protein